MPANSGSSVEPKSAAHLKQIVGSLPRRTSSAPFAVWTSTTFLSAHGVQSTRPLTINVVAAPTVFAQSRHCRDCICGSCHSDKSCLSKFPNYFLPFSVSRFFVGRGVFRPVRSLLLTSRTTRGASRARYRSMNVSTDCGFRLAREIGRASCREGVLCGGVGG